MAAEQVGAECRGLRADARRNRMKALEAGWRLLGEKRLEEISMEEVAREAEIGKGTLYRHYPTRESFIEALLMEGAGRVAATMHDRIPPDADAPTKLRSLVSVMYDAYESHYISPALILAMPDLSAVERGLHHPFAQIADRVRGILQQGVREGSFRPIDVEYVTMAVLTMMNPVAFVKGQKRLGYTRNEMEERSVELLLHALAAA